MNSPCPVCKDRVADHTKRFVETLGFCCTECHEFSLYAEKASRKVGIEGAVYSPIRYAPEPRTEKP